MKKCPFCAEDVQDAAIKCKHCGEMIGNWGGDKVKPVITESQRKIVGQVDESVVADVIEKMRAPNATLHAEVAPLNEPMKIEYEYQIRNNEGVVEKGVLLAKTEDDARVQLQAKGVEVLSVKPQKNVTSLKDVFLGCVSILGVFLFLFLMFSLIIKGCSALSSSLSSSSSDRSGEALKDQGDAYSVQGKPDQAIAAYSQAIQVNPNDGEAYGGRAILYFEKREYNNARRDAYRAKELGYELTPAFYDSLKRESGE